MHILKETAFAVDRGDELLRRDEAKLRQITLSKRIGYVCSKLHRDLFESVDARLEALSPIEFLLILAHTL